MLITHLEFRHSGELTQAVAALNTFDEIVIFCVRLAENQIAGCLIHRQYIRISGMVGAAALVPAQSQSTDILRRTLRNTIYLPK